MRVIDLLFLVLWGAFWIYWLVAAVSATRPRSHRGRYAGIGVRAAVILLVLLLRLTVLEGNAGDVDDPRLLGVGSGLLVLGLATAVWARVHLGRNWGMPMSEGVDPELVTTGPYRYVRHPIYSGLLLAMIGSAVALGVYWLVVVAVLGLYLVYSATVEERTMTRLFPATYPAYKQSSKMLIPFLL
jgi:protein-S-isoprenylcysteine O-methyltransferase Ste14